MLELTLDDGAALLLTRLFVLLQTQQLHRIEQSGKRVAQLMAEHGQKLIFAAVQVRQRLRLFPGLALQTAAIGNVVKASDGAGNFSPDIFQRNDIGDNSNARSVGPLDDDFLVIHHRVFTLQNWGIRDFRLGSKVPSGRKYLNAARNCSSVSPGRGARPDNSTALRLNSWIVPDASQE